MNTYGKEIERGIRLLADGELSAKERSELLNNIDNDHPEAWRDLSLAMVERQILIDAFQFKNTETSAIPSEKNPSRNILSLLMAAALVCLLCLGSWYLGKTNAGVPGDLITQPDQSTGKDNHEQSLAEANAMLQELLSGVPDTRQLSESVRQYGVELQPETAFYTTNLDSGEQLFLPVTTFKAVPTSGSPETKRQY